MNRQTTLILMVLMAALTLILLSLALPLVSAANGLAIDWQTQTPLPSPLSGGLGLVAKSQRLVTLGGESLTSGDPVTSVRRNQVDPWADLGAWEASGTAALSPPRAWHAAIRYAHAAGDRTCVIGGWDGSSGITSVQCADVSADGQVGAWQPGPSLPSSRSLMNLGAAVVDLDEGEAGDDLVYIAGGWDGFASRKEVYVSTVQANGSLGSWQPAASLGVGLFGLSLSAYSATGGDYLYAVGGHDGSGARGEVYRAQITNSQGALGGWQKLDGKDLPGPRERHAAVVYRDHLVVLGGRSAGASTNTVYAAAINSADGSLGAWATDYLENLPRSLDRHAAVVVSVPHCGEVIYVAGGRSGAGYESSVYRSACPTTDPWSGWQWTNTAKGLLVCPGTRASVLYGNQTAGKKLVATLDDGGPVVFDDGAYTLEYTLTEANSRYDLVLKPAAGSSPGETFSLSATIDGVAVPDSPSGAIARCGYLPHILRN